MIDPSVGGLVFLFAALAQVADAPPEIVRAEAVVQEYETAALRDVFDEGRTIVYDAVGFKLVAPGILAAKTIRVHFPSGSVANDSPLRKPGRRCRFDFDKNLLEADVFFRGALGNLRWLDAAELAEVAQREVVQPEKVIRPIDARLLATVEKELARLIRNANQEIGPDTPRPSSQVAYYLLAGLAAQGALLEHLPEQEQRLFELERQGGTRARLVSTYTDVRVALIDNTIQDKSGSYLLRTAVLWVQQNGQWQKKGRGVIATHGS